MIVFLFFQDLQDAHTPTTLTGIKNLFKNRIVLNTTEQIFMDFKKNTFHETAREKYHDTLKAYKRKDKIDLMKHLSVPLYDVFEYGWAHKQIEFISKKEY